MSITTKTGDDGKSKWTRFRPDGNSDYVVASKDSDLLEAIGTLDELQSVLAIAKTEMTNDKFQIIKNLGIIENDLYEIMGEIGYGKKISNYELRIMNLEKEIKKIEEKLPPIKSFQNFKSIDANRLNWVRALARRAERRVVSLSKQIKVDQQILIYLNRLSDYLFIMACLTDATAGDKKNGKRF